MLERKLEMRKPRLPQGLRVYAVGDVHGRADLLTQIFEMIDADLKHFPAHRSLQIFLGDYIDRGPDSRAVIDLLIERSRLHETICLKGNHEEILLDVLKNPASFRDWSGLGGVATLMSYGIVPNQDIRGNDGLELVESLRRAVPSSHLRFLNELKCSFSCGEFFFVHAGVKPGIPLDAQNEDDLLWIRSEFLGSSVDFGKYVVHGHTPVMQPDIRPNRINIDTGAYATGKLTLLAIEGDGMLVLT
jgi:serine/threonine protein phosphatase 1